jgi:hypothetical protein
MNLRTGPAKRRKRRSRKVLEDGKRLPVAGAVSLADEVSGAVNGHIGRCVARAIEHAAVLENIGSQAFTAVGELAREAQAEELLQKAHALRGLVLHGLGVLAELQGVAGSLAALAAVRQAQESAPE